MGDTPQDPPDLPNPESFGRGTGHDAEQFWNSTGLFLWNQVMNESGLLFQNIEWSDIEASNSSIIMRTFVESAKKFPPLHKNGSKPYDDKTVTRAFSAGVAKLITKFGAQMKSNKDGDYFPEGEQDSCRKQLKRDRSRNLMEGADDSDIWKGTYPLPRKNSKATSILQVNNHPTNEFMKGYKMIDFHTVCVRLFATGHYKKLLELIATYNAIGRGGEAKFMNYLNIFMTHYLVYFSVSGSRRRLARAIPQLLFQIMNTRKCVFISYMTASGHVKMDYPVLEELENPKQQSAGGPTLYFRNSTEYRMPVWQAELLTTSGVWWILL